MKSATVLRTGLVAAGLSVAAAIPAGAQTSTPAGPWITPNQTISLEGFLTYEELTKRLLAIEGRGKGLVEIESAGVTGEGRDIWLAKIGNPNNPAVLIVTQQHGDEPHGTEAGLDLIQTLSAGGGPARQILDELYVLIVPRVNPDGASLPTRGNAAFDTPSRNARDCFDAAGNTVPGELNQGRGVFSTRLGSLFSYDINRYHWPDWSQSWQILCNPALLGSSRHFDPNLNPVPEAQAVLDAYAEHQPIWVVDVHNQGFSVIDSDERPENDAFRPNRLVTGSILWPTNPDVDERARDFSKQMTLVMKKRSMELGHMEITRFGGGTFAGIARNAYGLLGSARLAMGEAGPLGGSVLVEIRGQIEGSILRLNLGQKSIGMLKNNVREMLMAALEATADGTILDEVPARVDELILDNDIPLNNPRVMDEEEAEAEEHAG